MSCLHQARMSSEALVVIRRGEDNEVKGADRPDATSQQKRTCSSVEAGAGEAQGDICDNTDKVSLSLLDSTSSTLTILCMFHSC